MAARSTASSQRLRALALYKELHRLGRDYEASYDFHGKLRRLYEKNRHLTDEGEIEKAIQLGEYIKSGELVSCCVSVAWLGHPVLVCCRLDVVPLSRVSCLSQFAYDDTRHIPEHVGLVLCGSTSWRNRRHRGDKHSHCIRCASIDI
ncbi:hypothetical protein V8B97DRAFT_1948681 [Scleroderma yunnanense]